MKAIDIILIILLIFMLYGAVRLYRYRKTSGNSCCSSGCDGNCAKCNYSHK